LPRISHKFFSLFAELFRDAPPSLRAALLCSALGLLNGCGGKQCGWMDRVFSEPSCHSLGLDAKRVAIGGSASCLGAAFSRKLSLSCPAGSGTALQCSSIADGSSAYVLLVPNNAGGSFRDTSGTLFSNCGDLWQAFYSGTLNQAQGYYATGTDAASRLNCSDAAGCSASLGSSCIVGWDSTAVPPGPSGTASLPNGTNLMACVYIDNSAQPAPVPPPASVGAWYLDPLQAVSVSGDLVFNGGWKDAY